MPTCASVTDPARKRRQDPGNPEVCGIFYLHKIYSDPATVEWVDPNCRTAGIGCVDCKRKLLEGLLPVQERLCEQLAILGRRLRIPCVATNNVHYAAPDGRRLADVLTCIRHHTTLDDAGAILYPNAERYLSTWLFEDLDREGSHA